MPQEVRPTEERHCPLHPKSSLFHNSGWWKCKECKRKVGKANLGNTNAGRGEDRGYDASDEAHGMVAKGSHGMPRRK